MVVSYDEPHHPFTCPVEYLEKYADFYYDLGEKAQDDLANKPEHHRLWAQAMPSPVGDDGLYHHPQRGGGGVHRPYLRAAAGVGVHHRQHHQAHHL